MCTMLLPAIITLLALNTVHSQKPSPCPDILSYEPRGSENDRWHAVINLRTRETYKGLWLSITLDRSADLLGNAFGDATTMNNREFLIKNNVYTLEAGTMTPVRFFVKYNAASIVPSVREINLNGRTICSEAVVQTTVGSTANVANRRPTSAATVKPSSLAARPSTSTSTRPNHGSSTNRPSSSNGRPSSFTDNSGRPTRPTNSNSRPSSFTDNSDVVRPNWPIEVTESYNRPDTIHPEAELITPEELDTGYNVDNGNNFNRPTFGNNREPDNYNPNTDYNQGSSSLAASPEGNEDFFAGDFSAIINRPQSNPSARPSGNQQCGIVATRPRPLISYGQNTEPGQWPWHAALYHSRGLQLMYTCGGTLISTNHILTAAHCVTKPRTNRPIKAQNILAYLGKYNLQKFGSEIQDREVGDIFVHPQYNYTGYYNDIAVLRLEEPVQISNYVRPVCLWEDNTDLNEVEGRLGTVVGWGFNEDGELTTSLMQAQMPVVSLKTCLYSNRDFFSQFTSENSFCAGFRNGTSVCNGDSGGGMVFPRRGTSGSRTVWQIRGLVSVGVAFQGKIICDTSQYVVFTDVAQHIDWIHSILSNYP